MENDSVEVAAPAPARNTEHSAIAEEVVDNELTGLEKERTSDDDETAATLEESEGDFRSPYDPKTIRVDPRVYSIRQILDMVADGELDLAPDFQRLKVWKTRQKSSLIESLLLRIPLPAFYFSSDDDGLLQVVDGVQRLSTIYDFVNNDFKLGRLEYLQDSVGKKFFTQINNTIWSRRIMNTQITAFVIDPQTPARVKFDIFRRINTGGSPLNSQEIRHCMSRTRSRNLLREMAEIPSFKSATAGVFYNNPRMADRELALRFIAFRRQHDIETYDYGSIDDLLTETTSDLDDPDVVSDQDLLDLKAHFDLAMNNAIVVFGSHAFRKWFTRDNYRYPINRSLFDVWSVELSKHTADAVMRMADKLQMLARNSMTENASFNEAISASTFDRNKVVLRFTTVKGIISQAIS